MITTGHCILYSSSKKKRCSLINGVSRVVIIIKRRDETFTHICNLMICMNCPTAHGARVGTTALGLMAYMVSHLTLRPGLCPEVART